MRAGGGYFQVWKGILVAWIRYHKFAILHEGTSQPSLNFFIYFFQSKIWLPYNWAHDSKQATLDYV